MKVRFQWWALAAVCSLAACSDDSGSDVSLPPLEITTSTTGAAPDSDGYAATVDGGQPQAIGVNDTLTITDLSSGDHTVGLSGVADNCEVAGANPRTITMQSGNPPTAAFSIACSAPPESPPPQPPPPPPPPSGTSIQRWTLVGSVPLSNWADVWGTSVTDYFVVGVPLPPDNVSVLHYDGSAWSSQAAPGGIGLQGVWGRASNDVFAAGYHLGRTTPAVVHFDGTSWSEQPLPPLAPGPDTLVLFRSVWGSSPSDVFAVGTAYGPAQFGFIAHFDGRQWSWMDFANTRVELLDVWGTSSNNVYAVGGIQDPARGENDLGIILHFDGSSWTEVFRTQPIPHQIHLKAAWGTGPSDIFVVGDRGQTYHFDGTRWRRKTTSFFRALHEVWGPSGSDVFSVGSHGIIFHYDGSAWARADSSVTPDLFGVWGGSAVDAFAVGDSGIILHGTP
ncbi:MAG TPA: hypothetical protein VH763_11400 [Gemmatimonadales bacterium]